MCIHTFTELPHDALYGAAFGPRGEVLLNDDNYLYRYQYRSEQQYSFTGKNQLPPGFGRHCMKAITDSSIYIHHKINQPTYQLTTDLSTVTTLHHEGQLRGCVHPESLVYGVEKSEDDCIIQLHGESSEVSLRPPESRRWGRSLSAIRVGQYFVVISFGATMDVFTHTGNIHCFVLHTHDYSRDAMTQHFI